MDARLECWPNAMPGRQVEQGGGYAEQGHEIQPSTNGLSSSRDPHSVRVEEERPPYEGKRQGADHVCPFPTYVSETSIDNGGEDEGQRTGRLSKPADRTPACGALLLSNHCFFRQLCPAGFWLRHNRPMPRRR